MASEPAMEPVPGRSVLAPALWVVIVGLHSVVAVFAWRLLPHGFATGHPRFWANEVMPVALLAAGAVCLVALWRRQTRVAAFTISLLTGLHGGMAAAWALVFPMTGARLAVISTVITAILCACAFGALRRARGAQLQIVIGAVVGIMMGSLVPWSQRGPDATTHPAGPVHDLGHVDRDAASDEVALPPWARVVPQAGALGIEAGAVQIVLHPLLTFISRSPDRGWTVFAGARDRLGPARRYDGTSDGVSYYAGDEPAILRLTADNDVLNVDAETVLPRPVYSHLNSFCEMEISGHRRLFISFSPMPDQRIEVTYSEYPTGRPSRFAYIDASSEIHVVQSTSGEKGPFTELAHGHLAPDAPLGLILFDQQQELARIELADFAAQASTQPSPTAGWGVPENAIEFSLAGDRPDAPASIFITLAGTSVGRGWDSVGHAPGLYRNRIVIRRSGP